MRIEQRFSELEIWILKFSAEGKTSKDIAIDLGMSYRYIENRKAKIFDKLETKTITHAVVKAIKQNLISA